jgi:glucosylceramidase
MWQTSTPTTSTATATLTVNDGTTYQTFSGFGGAFNELGWKYLSTLGTSDQQKAMTLLFDANNGAHFMYGRIPIGSSDYAVTRYTDDEISSGNDYNMTSFNVTEDKKYLMPYVEAALAVNPNIHFWGSPWTPPTWMKSGTPGTTQSGTCTISGGGQSTSPFDGEKMKTDTMTLNAYGQYFVKWIQAYANTANLPAPAIPIKIEALMPQNEPDYVENYPSANWDPATYNTFVQTLSKALSGANLTTQIFLGTNSKDDTTQGTGSDGAIIQKVMGDTTSSPIIKGFGLQWNFETNGAFASDVASILTGSSQPKWQTEHKCGNYPWNPAGSPAYNSTQAPNDYAYGTESWGNIRDWIKAGVNSYSAWNMVLDNKGAGLDTCRQWNQDSLLVVNGGSLVVTPAYYVFRHLSQYIQAGATRVGSTGGGSMDVLAFKNPDGTHVTVMYNSGTSGVQTVLSAGSGKYSFTVPANGFATVYN